MRGIFVAPAAGLMGACALLGYEHHQIAGAIELFQTPNGGEIGIPYRVSGRGNVHDPFSYSKWQFLAYDWIQIAQTEGLSHLEGRVKTPCPLGLNRWYSPAEIQGTVDIGGDTIHIDLNVPNPTKSGWEPYEFNGAWRLVRLRGSPTKPAGADVFWNCEPPSNNALERPRGQ
jgi:hypothetical protein